MQIRLAESSDRSLAARAVKSLRETHSDVLVDFVLEEAGYDDLVVLAREISAPVVLDAIIRRRDVPRGLLVAMAATLPPLQQESLILRQDAIVEEPGILEALETNPRLDRAVGRRIQEYREHLLAPTAGFFEVVGDSTELTAAELSAIERARSEPAQGEVDDQTGLSEGQVRSLPVPLRIKLARGASKTLRGILIRDLNRMVALSVLANNPMSDDEIEQVASSRSVIEDVLVGISRRREWIGKYRIILALAKNPKTPIAIAARLVSRLGVRDLKMLATDRNVGDTVRSTASRLYKIKAR